MPIKQNAKKALRKSVKREERNRAAEAAIKSLRVLFRKAVTLKDAAKAAEIAKQLGQRFDKSASKGMMKKNTVARYKSRMMARLNALSAK